MRRQSWLNEYKGWLPGGQRSGGSGGGSPPPDPWVPNNDPAKLVWYEGDTYDIADGGKGGSYYVPKDKYTLSLSLDQQPIAPPSNPTLDGVQITTVDGVPTFVYQGYGTKTSDTFQHGDLDIYLVFKNNAPNDGFTSRLVDSDYGNGFWMGRGPTATDWGGGVKQGSNPYGQYVDSSAFPFQQYSWLMLNLSRSGGDTRAALNGDFFSNAAIGTTDSFVTTPNPIGIGSDLGGNSGSTSWNLALLMVFSSYDVDTRLKREGWIAHHMEAVSPGMKALLIPASHIYYNDPPTL